MNWWWVNLIGEELRRKWRPWRNGRLAEELRVLKSWIKQSDPVLKDQFSEDQMVRLRSRIMKKITEQSQDIP